MASPIRLLTIFTLITACAIPALARAQVEVKLWTLLSGSDGARMRSIVDDFNAS